MRTVPCRVADLIEFHLETKTICNFISRRIAICARATCQQTIVHQRNEAKSLSTSPLFDAIIKTLGCIHNKESD